MTDDTPPPVALRIAGLEAAIAKLQSQAIAERGRAARSLIRWRLGVAQSELARLKAGEP